MLYLFLWPKMCLETVAGRNWISKFEGFQGLPVLFGKWTCQSKRSNTHTHTHTHTHRTFRQHLKSHTEFPWPRRPFTVWDPIFLRKGIQRWTGCREGFSGNWACVEPGFPPTFFVKTKSLHTSRQLSNGKIVNMIPDAFRTSYFSPRLWKNKQYLLGWPRTC